MQWQRQMKRALDKLGLTHTQFVLLAALAWLSKHQETVTQIDVATHATLDRMMTSKVLRTLQQKGYLSRQEHHQDTRAKSIRLTAAGEQLLQQAIGIVQQVDEQFFSRTGLRSAPLQEHLLKLLGKDA
jgi:DNA-binding MarR family transcriptional regulator